MNPGRDRAWLLASLPHQGAMNLLDRVVEWGEAHVAARATGHRDAKNPLRRGTLLPDVSLRIQVSAWWFHLW